jgi:hypothetical protein
LAVDGNGRAHLVYLAKEENANNPGIGISVNYAHWNGVAWQTELIRTSDTAQGTYIHDAQIVLDADDNPHLLDTHYDDTTRQYNFFHTYQTDLQWQTGQLPFGGAVFDTALAEDGALHLTYGHSAASGLWYARQTGPATWETEVVDASANVQQVAFALDGAGAAHIVYTVPLSETVEALFYTTQSGSDWSTPQLVVRSDEFYLNQKFHAVDLALGAAGISYISFSLPAGTYVGRWNGVKWAQAYWHMDYSSGHVLALDANGLAHLALTTGELSVRHVAEQVNGDWQVTAVHTNSPTIYYLPGYRPSLALDEQNNPHISYFQGEYHDLGYAAWQPAWQTQHVEATSFSLHKPALALAGNMPALSYWQPILYDSTVRLATWQAGWQSEAATPPYTAGGGHTTLAYDAQARPYLSYVDTWNGRLMLAYFESGQWQEQVVVSPYSNSTTAEHALVMDGNGRPLVIYVAPQGGYNNDRLVIARWNGAGWERFTDHAAPASSVVGVTAVPLVDGGVAISYVAENLNELRLALWSEGEGWRNELVDAADTADFIHSLAADGRPNESPNVWLALAYFHPDSQNIYRARVVNGALQTSELFLSNPGAVNSLSLAFGLGLQEFPRLAYTVNGSPEVQVYTMGGVETAVTAPTAPTGVTLLSGWRDHLAYLTNGAIYYTFRSATVPLPPLWNCLPPVCICPDDREARGASYSRLLPEGTPLPDTAVLGGLSALFQASAGGRDYANLYFQHAEAMADAALSDPALVWESYLTLQNLLPGLEALVLGYGDNVTVTQAMVDQSLDIWIRLADAGSPELAAVIHNELARYNNLQDFVGLTFNQWAQALGVEPFDNRLYLPIVRR